MRFHRFNHRKRQENKKNSSVWWLFGVWGCSSTTSTSNLSTNSAFFWLFQTLSFKTSNQPSFLEFQEPFPSVDCFLFETFVSHFFLISAVNLTLYPGRSFDEDISILLDFSVNLRWLKMLVWKKGAWGMWHWAFWNFWFHFVFMDMEGAFRGVIYMCPWQTFTLEETEDVYPMN